MDADEPSSPGRRASRFPDPALADREGLIGVGGELAPDWLLDAYRHGVFPWPSSDDEPMLWWSPDPRAVIELDGLRINRRLARTLRSGRFRVTCDRDFGGVLRGCAEGPGREEGTWLTPRMREAYTRMHRLGHAHSIEAWRDGPGEGEPDGGLYGVAVGGVFAAESMFRRQADASKVCLAWLVKHLERRGYSLLDIQQWTPHTGRLGATHIARSEYLRRLDAAIDLPVSFGAVLEASVADW